MKVCSKCKKNKKIGGFHKDKYKHDGLRPSCKECRKSESAKHYAKDMKKSREYSRRQAATFRSSNPIAIRNIKRRHFEKIKDTVEYKLQDRLRSRFRRALKKNYKSGSAVRDLGCSIKYFKQYLESMFYNNLGTGEVMAWENYGLYGWHIDHIKPLASFDLTDRDQVLEAVNYVNLQPLWAEENLKKGSKII